MASDTPWWMQCSVFDELIDYEPSPSPERRPAASRRVQLVGQGGWRNRGRIGSTVAARPTCGPPRHPPRLWQAPLERRRRAQAQTANGSAFWTGAAQAIAAGVGSIGLRPKFKKPRSTAAAVAPQRRRRPAALPPSPPSAPPSEPSSVLPPPPIAPRPQPYNMYMLCCCTVHVVVIL